MPIQCYRAVLLATAGLMFFIPVIRSEMKSGEYIHPNNRQKSVLQGTMKDLLDFKDSPHKPIYPSSKSRYAATAYMQQLFKEYQGRPSSKPSVVRSLNPDPESRGHIVSFKLDSLQNTKSVTKGEIHFNMRHRNPSKPFKKQRTMLRCFAKNKYGEWTALPLRSVQVSWVAFDATDVLNRILEQNHPSPSSLEVKFLRERRLKPKRALKSAKILQRNAPFLLVHSDETPVVKQDETLNAFYSGESLEHNRVKRRTDASYYSYQTSAANEADKRKPKAVENRTGAANEDVIQHVRVFQQNGPGILKSRKKHRRQRKKNRKSRFRERSWKKRGLEFSENEPFNEKGFSNEDKKESKKSNSLNYGVGPLDKSPGMVLLKEGELSPADRPCSRRRLSVSFKDIGWGDWVIAPVNFEAFYCTGTCPFPLTPDVNPTNHALIQSMIHAIGIDPFVPALCCAPEKMDSLTLLYYEETGNIALKNYPKMTVSSCACL